MKKTEKGPAKPKQNIRTVVNKDSTSFADFEKTAVLLWNTDVSRAENRAYDTKVQVQENDGSGSHF